MIINPFLASTYVTVNSQKVWMWQKKKGRGSRFESIMASLSMLSEKMLLKAI